MNYCKILDIGKLSCSWNSDKLGLVLEHIIKLAGVQIISIHVVIVSAEFSSSGKPNWYFAVIELNKILAK